MTVLITAANRIRTAMRASFDFHWHTDQPDSWEMDSNIGEEPPKSMSRPIFNPQARARFRLLTPEVLADMQATRTAIKRLQRQRLETPESLQDGSVSARLRHLMMRFSVHDDFAFPPNTPTSPDPLLADGQMLPPTLRDAVPLMLLGEPLEDIDPFYRCTAQTFVVVNSERRLHRFSVSPSLWMLTVHNPARRLALRVILTHHFRRLMLGLVFLHVLAMCIWTESTTYEFPLLFVYLLETVSRVICRGLMLNQFSCLRDPFDALDAFITIAWGGLIVGGNPAAGGALQCLRLLRVIKTVRDSSIIGGEAELVSRALIRALTALLRAAPPILLSVATVAVAAMQSFEDAFSRKCVPPPPLPTKINPDAYEEFINEPSNWLMDNVTTDDYALCGNSSKYIKMWDCPKEPIGNSTVAYSLCVEGVGPLPDAGLTDCGNLGYSLLVALRFLTRDALNTLYEKMIRVQGTDSLTFVGWAILALALCAGGIGTGVVVNAADAAARKFKSIKDAREADARRKALDTGGSSPQSKNSPQNPLSLSQLGIDKIPIDTRLHLMGLDDGACNGGTPRLPTPPPPPVTPLPKVILPQGADMACSSLRRPLQALVTDVRIEVATMVVMLLDAVALLATHHNMDEALAFQLRLFDLGVSILYACEAWVKVFALGKLVLRDPCRIFEVLMALTSLAVHAVRDPLILPVLRATRTMRIVRLSSLLVFWEPAARMQRRVRAAGGMIALLSLYLTAVLALMGIMSIRMLKPSLEHEGETNRWAPTTFFHSVLSVFAAVVGQWTAPTAASGASVYAVTIFLCTLLLGYFLLCPLFLAALVINAPHAEDIPLWSGSRLGEVVVWLKSGCGRKGDCPFGEEGLKHHSPHTLSASGKMCPFLQGKRCAGIRNICDCLSKSRMFDAASAVIILLASIAATVQEDTLERPEVARALSALDVLVGTLFGLELTIRLVALPDTSDACYRALVYVDLVIITMTVGALSVPRGTPQDNVAFRAARSARTVRLFRVILWWPAAKEVVTVVAEGLPLLMSSLFLFAGCLIVLALMGVQLFAGLFYKCVDSAGLYISADTVPSRTACEAQGFQWVNSRMHFDDAGSAMLSLLHITMLQGGWIKLLRDAVDSSEVDLQPIRDINPYAATFFGVAILLGGAVYLKILTLAHLETLLRRSGRRIDQLSNVSLRHYVAALQQMDVWITATAKKDRAWTLCVGARSVMNSPSFEAATLALIVAHLVPLALRVGNTHPAWSDALRFVHIAFLATFGAEMILRLLARGPAILLVPLDISDLCITVAAGCHAVGSLNVHATPSLLRMVRVMVRTGPLLSKLGVRKLRAWIAPWCAMGNAGSRMLATGALLWLMVFVASTLALALFSCVPDGHFRTLEAAEEMLAPVCAGFAWDRVWYWLADANCVSFSAASTFIMTILILSTVLIALFPALVVSGLIDSADAQNVGMACAADSFRVSWMRKADIDGRMQVTRLNPFLVSLEPPLLLPHVNSSCPVPAIDIPVGSDGKMHAGDVANALICAFLTRRGLVPPSEAEALAAGMLQHRLESDYIIVSTTRERARHEQCARVIQTAWRRYRAFGGQYDLR